MRMKSALILLINYFLVFNSVAQDMFSKQQVLDDLDYLQNSLEQAHYNLYAYTTKEDFEQNCKEIRAKVKDDSLSLLEATSLFQHVISKANNGHTEIPFPSRAYVTYAYAHGTLCPLELAFEDGKALVRKNWSGNSALAPGTEITSINGETMEYILQKIQPLISAEREYFKLAKIELISFPRLYWQAFGQVTVFDLEVIRNGKKEMYTVKSVPLIDGFEMKRNEIFFDSREFKFMEETAYLRPGNFSGDEKAFQHFIDSAFYAINQHKSQHLIIDLRNNLGGDNSFSDYLVSYLADKPFQWNSEFSLKTSAILKEHVISHYDTTEVFWQQVLSHENGTIYPYFFEDYPPQEETKRFKGKVYVLVNRQTHSQAAVTSAQLQDYGWATIVGEETGDYPSLFASQYSYNLPNTSIEVKIAKGAIVRVNGSKKEEGVQPDIVIKDHLLDEDDEILKGLLEIIEKQLD